MGFVNFLDIFDGREACAGLNAVFFYGVYVVKVIQIAVPIALIIWGSIDLLKSIISGDEKKISAARKPFIQRLISAVIVFLLPWIVNMVIGFTTGTKEGEEPEWKTCWKAAWNKGQKPDVSTPGNDLWNDTTPSSNSNLEG